MEAYGYQLQKALELFKKIKRSDQDSKSLEGFKEDCQKKIAEKEKKIKKEEEIKKLNELDMSNFANKQSLINT